MVERGRRWPCGAAGRWVAATLLWVLVLATGLPGLALASSDGGAVTGATAAGGEAASAGPAGSSAEPGWWFAVGYYARYAAEQVRLWASFDPAGDAALAASFAQQRATQAVELAPGSDWFERLAADIAAYLRLAQERLVEAQAEGAATDQAVAALQQAAAQVAELPQRAGAAGSGDGTGEEALTGPADAAASGGPADTGAGDVASGAGDVSGSAGAEVDDGQPATAAPQEEPALAEEGGTGEGAAEPAGEAPEAVEPGDEAGTGALDEALEAAAEAELVAGSVAMMDPAEITALRDQGYGYGQIALLYATAQAIRLAGGEEVGVLDLAAQLAALAAGPGSGSGGEAAPPGSGDADDATPAPTGDAAEPAGEAGSSEGQGLAAPEGTAAGATGATLDDGTPQTGVLPATKVRAFGRTLKELLALYGIERRDLKPGRWIAAAHRGTLQPPAEQPAGEEPEGTEPEQDGDGVLEDGQAPEDGTAVEAPEAGQPDQSAPEAGEAVEDDEGEPDQDAVIAAAEDDEDDADRPAVQHRSEDKPGRAHAKDREERGHRGGERGRGGERSGR